MENEIAALLAQSAVNTFCYGFLAGALSVVLIMMILDLMRKPAANTKPKKKK